MRHTMITTTSYGSWLPGDARGYVHRGEILPGSAELQAHAARLLKSEPVCFTEQEQRQLFEALQSAAREFDYGLTDASVESWHLHWIVVHEDAVKNMVGRLKNRLRQSLNRGRVWTSGYHFRERHSEEELLVARRYIARHKGARLVGGQPT